MSTKIGWCHYTAQDGKLISGATLNPIKGCSHAGYRPADGGPKKAHPGCERCYAEKWVKGPYPGCSKATAKWDGTIEFFPERILWPFQKTGFTARKDGNKRIVFLCSESDMGHPNVPDDVWMAINGMMALSPWNIYKDLTKRPEVQAERLNASSPLQCVKAFMLMTGIPVSEAKKADIAKKSWSDLDHIHRYVSVSDQTTADALIPELLKMPAAVRGISLEPMVGPVNLRNIDADKAGHRGMYWVDVLTGHHDDMGRPCSDVAKIDHVIVGGESGQKARPCDIAWIRSVADQCRQSGCPVFVKQMGSTSYELGSRLCQFTSFQQWVDKASSWLSGITKEYGPTLDGAMLFDSKGRQCFMGREMMRARDEGTFPVTAYNVVPSYFKDSKGSAPAEWPEDLRIQMQVGEEWK